MKSSYLLALAMTFSTVFAVGASAQNPGGAAFVGTTKASPGCPVVHIHIVRNSQTLSGIVFYEGGKGYSEIAGTTDGTTVDYHQTTIHGDGPTGAVHGTISPTGVMILKVVGSPCSYETSVPMLHEYGNG